jgi:hypothetical protein
MPFPVPVSASAATVAVSGTHAVFTTTMAAGEKYVLVSSTLAWCQQGAAPVATAAAGSWLIPANTPTLIDGGLGAKLSILQHTAGGSATLTKVRLAI